MCSYSKRWHFTFRLSPVSFHFVRVISFFFGKLLWVVNGVMLIPMSLKGVIGFPTVAIYLCISGIKVDSSLFFTAIKMISYCHFLSLQTPIVSQPYVRSNIFVFQICSHQFVLPFQVCQSFRYFGRLLSCKLHSRICPNQHLWMDSPNSYNLYLIQIHTPWYVNFNISSSAI